MVSRQDRLMNYDTYYGSYGGEGKYLYVQDMAAQTGDIANASLAFFDAVTWWNGIGTETVLYRQALARLGLTADEYALIGMNADDVVRLAKLQQRLEWGPMAQAERGAIRYRKVPSRFDPDNIDLGQERAEKLFQKAADIANIDLWKYVDRVTYEPGETDPHFFITRGGRRVIHVDPATLSGPTENQLIRAYHEITHAQKCYHFVQRDFGGDFAAAWSAWDALTKNEFVYSFDEVIAERMAVQRVEKYLGVLSRGQRGESYNSVIWPNRSNFWPDLP